MSEQDITANFVDNTTYFAVTVHDNASSVIPERKTEDEKNVCLKETNNESGGGDVGVSGYSTPSLVDSTIEEDDESKSCCSSGKDSGVGKSTDEFVNGRRSVDSNNTSYNGTENTPAYSRSRLSSCSQVDLDSSSTILWGASLLYYTGIPTPKIKEHHFTASAITPVTARSRSSSGSTFSLFKGSKRSHSTLSLQSSESPAMEDGRQKRSSWRFGGSSKKYNTLPIKTPSPLSLADSGGGFSGGNVGENSGSEGMSSPSPSQRRHASCLTPSPESSRAQSSTGIFGRFRNNSNSLRILKSGSSTSGFSSFLDKSSSLPRSPGKNRICEELSEQEQPQIEKSSKDSNHALSPHITTTTSSGGLKSAKKAIRNSFKAARSLLPSSSSSKIGPVQTSKEGNSTSSKRGKLSLSPSPVNDDTDKEHSSAVCNASAPNTPVAVKMSKLERAKKRFSSTLSLHTSTDQSSSCTGRSKSTSTLNIVDVRTTSRRNTLSWDNDYLGHSSETRQNEIINDKVDNVDGEHSSLSTTVCGTLEGNKSGLRRESGSSSLRSPFRFISRSKKSKESKPEIDSQGEIRLSQVEHIERHLGEEKTLPEDCRAPHQKHSAGKLTASPSVAVEKPAKKRMSLVESILRSSGSSSKKKNANKNDINNETNQNQLSIPNASFVESMIETETRKNKEPISNARRELAETQEIVTFDNEPRVRPTKAVPKKELKNSGGETTESSACINVTNTAPVKSARSASRAKKEHKVKETSIDISPERKNEPLQQLQHPCYVVSKGGKVESSIVGPVGGSPLVLQSSINTSLLKTSPKKNKSYGLISGLASLTPTTSFSSVKNMGEKTGRGNKKKNSKKPLPVSSSNPNTSTNQQQHPFVNTSVLPAKNNEIPDSTTLVENAVISKLLNGDNNNKYTDLTSEKPQEEEYKDSPKLTVQENGNAFVDKDDAQVIVRNEDVDVLKDQETTVTDAPKSIEDDNDEENNPSQVDAETACTESFRQLQPFNYDLEPVEEGKKERLYKVLVVGELGAGKTSIIKRYVHQFFSQHYRATIGVDFALKVLRWDPDTVVRLQLWDIAGQERFGSMTRVYYKEAVGAFVVFDVTRSATLEAVPKWKADLDAKVALPDGRPIPTVLLANKSDQPKEGIAANREKMNDFCQQQGFSAWFETSAKDNINIDESANFLVSKILEMDKWSQEPLVVDPDKVELTANGKHKGSSSSNCAC